LEHTLPELCVLLDIQQNVWFMHDGAPAHFSYAARNDLETAYTGQKVSLDLNPLGFFSIQDINKFGDV
jgi:hypothetical protein